MGWHIRTVRLGTLAIAEAERPGNLPLGHYCFWRRNLKLLGLQRESGAEASGSRVEAANKQALPRELQPRLFGRPKGHRSHERTLVGLIIMCRAYADSYMSALHVELLSMVYWLSKRNK